jgi:hypothetical protein
MALKRPTVAPAEGLLPEAVLKHGALCRTAACDPRPTIVLIVAYPGHRWVASILGRRCHVSCEGQSERGSWRSNGDPPRQKSAVRLMKDDRVHQTCLVALELHAKTLKLLDRESAVPVGDEKISRLAGRR